MQTRVSQWGNSLGVRIPKEIAGRYGFAEGQLVFLQPMEAGLMISRPSRPRLEDLLVGLTPEALSEAFDWGPDEGRERVE